MAIALNIVVRDALQLVVEDVKERVKGVPGLVKMHVHVHVPLIVMD